MIKLINNTVYLNETDFKSISGIWGAFRSYPDYCADLLKLGNDRYDEFSKLPDTYIARIDKDISVENYTEIFNKVFLEKNYKIVVE